MLDVTFRCKHRENSYIVFASTDTLRCFECGDIGHKKFACPHKRAKETANTSAAGQSREDGETQAETHIVSVVTDQTTELAERRKEGQKPGEGGSQAGEAQSEDTIPRASEPYVGENTLSSDGGLTVRKAGI